jgi:hypothetical protein
MPLADEENPMLNRHTTPVSTDREARRTVIPSPRQDAMFTGWGIKL